MRPEMIAVRTINQYRQRDVLAYLGLRYYLENDCAVRDIWSKEVAIHLVKTRLSPVYFRSYHYKEISEDNIVVYRNIFIPGPNEALAEAILLNECSNEPAFKSAKRVYSYRFPKPNSKEGIFRTYFPGFRERHQSIADACINYSQAEVLYTDIKKFYPNISTELALNAWRSTCDLSSISTIYRELGENLLIEHAKTAIANNEGAGILTGPMFSHLIANLVLAKVDQIMLENMKGRYWRYVDDMVLVGNGEQIEAGRHLLSTILDDMGLSLHDGDKDFVVDANQWLVGVNDFNEPKSKLWVSLVSNIKRFLVTNSDKRNDLARAFSDNGINIPLLDYSKAVAESSYLEALSDSLRRSRWLPKSIRSLTISELLRDALQIREIYEGEMTSLLETAPNIKGFERKRLIPKLRFYSGRLTCLSTPDVLASISSALNEYSELNKHSRVMKVIQSRDVSSILDFGSDTVQAASQILRIHNESCQCSLSEFGEVELQALAILRLNGIKVEFADDILNKTILDPLNQFALGHASSELMKSKNLFIREISCLRGTEFPQRHNYMLDNAFDRDEKLTFDIIDQLNETS